MALVTSSHQAGMLGVYVPGGGPHQKKAMKKDVICRYWLQRRCTRRPCPFAHPPPRFCGRLQSSSSTFQQPPPPAVATNPTSSSLLHVKDDPAPAAADLGEKEMEADADADAHQPSNCAYKPAHLATFRLQQSAYRGMVLPASATTLFTIGEDDSFLHAWPTTGIRDEKDIISRCDRLQLPGPPNCLFNSFCDPNWLFVGLTHQVLVCDLSAHRQHSLSVGAPVLSITSLGNLLLAGLADGSICMWKFVPESSSFHAAASISLHDQSPHAHAHAHASPSPVLCLEPGAGSSSTIVYAGLANGAIHVWDVASPRCCQLLGAAHDKAVTHLLRCDLASSAALLLSASPDGRIKLWNICPHSHRLELQGTFDCDASTPGEGEGEGEADAHNSSKSVPLALVGVLDGRERTPVLFAAYSDHQVRILHVPSLQHVATIHTSHPVAAMNSGPSHVLCLGTTAGELSVWKWR